MKKKALKIVYRVIPCLVCVMIVISSMTMPAQAAVPDWAIDWNDYVSDLEIDANTGIVTVSLPRDLFLIKVSGTVHDNYFYWGVNGTLKNVYLESGYSYNVTFYSDPNKPIYVGNIPDGSRISVSASISDDSKVSYGTPYCYWLYKSYDENNKWIMDTTARQSLTDGDIVSNKYPIQSVTVDGLFVKEQGARTAYAAVFGVEFNSLIPLDFGYWSFQMDSLEISFPVSSLTADKIMHDQNLKLLNKINTELESQGQTLDSILSGTPEMNDQISNAVGGMQSSTDKLGDLGESMKVEQPDVSGISTDIGSLVNYNSILAYVGPFLAIWNNNSTLFGFLTIVLTLVIVSWVMFGKKG